MTAPWLLRPFVVQDLPEVTLLLTEALPYDRAAVVATEKLCADNGTRQGQARSLVARSPGGALLGLLSQAGRFLKLLCVAKDARRRGLGTDLLHEARRDQPGPLRACDHPGNYLSPGLDVREGAGRAFLRARGFREVAEIMNVRAPIYENPLVTEERAALLAAAAGRRGYSVRRIDGDNAEEVAALLQMTEISFSRVWALELRRALGKDGTLDVVTPEGPCVHAAFAPGGAPVAFAAHDGNNRGLGWFGPMGTLSEHRGQGLGEALLLPCLLDVADRPEGGVIAWVGPVEFYRRTCGAIVDRQFVVYEEG